MASIHSQEENDLIANLAGVGNRVWFGQSDKVEEDTWVHTDDTKQTWTNWNPGEPNDSNGEDCAEINAPFAFWNDIPCAEPRGSVCKWYE